MKNLILFMLISLSVSTFAQSSFDKALNEISSDISEKLTHKNKKKVVVLYITDIDKSQTAAGKYMADIISVNIVNNSNNFEVFDRENLSEIVEAKKIIAEGYVDASKANELGKALAVEAIVIGNYTVLSNTLKLTLKALDVNNGLVVAASLKDFSINEDIGTLLGINVGQGRQNKTGNRGFNGHPLNSEEDYNNPNTVNNDCRSKNTGDYCFQNNTKLNLTVFFKSESLVKNGYYASCTLQAGQTQCFYNAQAGAVDYVITETRIVNQGYSWSNEKKYGANGTVNVEECKSKTFIIR